MGFDWGQMQQKLQFSTLFAETIGKKQKIQGAK
jgi:hypothetical protein